MRLDLRCRAVWLSSSAAAFFFASAAAAALTAAAFMNVSAIFDYVSLAQKQVINRSRYLGLQLHRLEWTYLNADI